MLRPSKKLVCTIEAVLDIAYNAGDRPVRAKEITERQGVPLETVRTRLKRAVARLFPSGGVTRAALCAFAKHFIGRALPFFLHADGDDNDRRLPHLRLIERSRL